MEAKHKQMCNRFRDARDHVTCVLCAYKSRILRINARTNFRATLPRIRRCKNSGLADARPGRCSLDELSPRWSTDFILMNFERRMPAATGH